MNNEPHILAHRHSIHHKSEIMNSDVCGCFYCLETFEPARISSWADSSSVEQTATCPECSIDSVIGSASGFPITKDFLTKMKKHWFGDF